MLWQIRRNAQIRRKLVRAVEPLERRMLLSLSPAGAEFRINTFTTGAQDTAAISADPDGDFVVAWSGNGSGDGNGVFAQRYDPAGVAQGTNFLVNSSTTFSQSDASVAMDADGDFVIAWENRMSGASSDYDIFARRYNAAGVAQGGEVRVNTFSLSDQRDASVAIDASGNFVITWMSFGQQSANTRGIYAQRYNAVGVKQGGELHVNTITTASQTAPAAAMDASGDFVIAWTTESDFGIHAQRFDSIGAEVGAEFNVNSATTNSGDRASVAMDATGDFVVIWNGTNIWARRFDSNGLAQGLPFAAIAFTTGFPVFSSVAMDADGDFLVTCERDGPDGSSYGVFGQSFNAAGQPQGTEFRVNTFTTNRQRIPAVAMDADGDAVVAWQSLFQDSTNSYGVYAQRYDESKPDTAPPMVGGLFFNGSEVMPGQQFTEVVPSMVLSFSEDMSVAGGTGGTNSATNPANYGLLRNGNDISGLITSATFGFNATTRKFEVVLTFSSALLSGNYVIKARDTLRDLSGNALDGNFDGAQGGDFARTISSSVQVPFGPEFRVNTFTTGAQGVPAAAMDAVGNFVVVWAGNGAGDADGGIFAQRFNGGGGRQGPEFRVNTFTTGIQSNPAIAIDAFGNFVVVWDGAGVVAQRYNAQGVAQGGEIIVGSGISPDVAMDADGDFVVTWRPSGPIAARRYDALGQPQGDQFTVPTTFAQTYSAPSIAMDASGDFVIVWEGRTTGFIPPPPLPPEIVSEMGARRFSASGVGGPQFNPAGTTNAGGVPHVAMDSDGDFVITWQTLTDVRARPYDSGGTGGAVFPVNTTTSEFIGTSAIAMDGDGEFVVTWSSAPFSTDPHSELHAQRFSAAAERVGPEFPVNTFTLGNQASPAVAMSQDGNIVFVWSSDIQDPDGSPGVYGQLIVSSIPSPTVDDSAFLLATLPQRLQFKFSQKVSASLGTNDVVLENVTTGQTIPSSDLSLSYNASTDTATFSYSGNASGIAGLLPDGNYRATLLASGIFNEGAAALAANHVFNFFFINGDANHDGIVDITDLGTLATNWQQANRSFAQGDFNFDGFVSIADLGILATNWQKSLPTASSTTNELSLPILQSTPRTKHWPNELPDVSESVLT